MRMHVVALCFLLGACSLVPPTDLPPSGSSYSAGGEVLAWANAVDDLEDSGEPYVAPADCRSACTTLLGADNVCWRPQGTLHFHSASYRGDPTFPFVGNYNEVMASYYPPALEAWFLSDQGPGGQRSTTFVVIPVADLNTVWGADVTICPQGQHPDA